ncbi:UV RADIATION RESISTANCE-ASSOCIATEDPROTEIN [Salix purpurea]|uniref:UV RADIATION RESISTANCE-ASSOCIATEDPROTEIN n=1 Tax=Salix purpurea TaxID=77065 RepID=A0A9Q0PC72_SALPP|nr:UV RADIATION RESISTANCE-ASSOCIATEDPROTEIN [Salix purpurea]KAJ6685495.1 UV RADIATION RESISTANCE-ASSOCIATEDPROTEIN [Salix purpurea]KAJ6685497.1 UV RADIATION RESISTANCE-ASSOCIATEDPROTEIN [Salix purpurea]
MNKKSSCCAICENSNRASICPICVNYRLNEYSTLLKSLNSRRDSLYSKLSVVLVAKGKADDQFNWRVQQNEKLAILREKLHRNKEQLAQGKAKVEKLSQDLKKKNGMLESARNVLEKNRVEQLEKFYPNFICTQSLGHMAITSELLHKQSVVIKQICKLFPQRRVNVDGDRNFSGQYDQICNARLPRGLDPHSVSSEELAAALGYMVQLLNLVAHNLAAPTIHNAGFAGSCSRIWQRDSYWNACPSSRSNEYPLFIPRQNYCSTSAENSWTDKSSSNFGVASMESERRLHLDSTRSNSFNYSSVSPHSVETHKDLQKGVSLLKKSVACVTAYCYNLLCLDVPSDMSTFEAFAKLLSTLSSSKEVRSVFNLKMACSRSCKQVQKLNKSVWDVNSAISSSALLESAHALQLMKNTCYNNLPNSTASFIFATEISDGKNESFIDGWDLVEHPTFPPPPSQVEDIEHWTRAMFIDATKK